MRFTIAVLLSLVLAGCGGLQATTPQPTQEAMIVMTNVPIKLTQTLVPSVAPSATLLPTDAPTVRPTSISTVAPTVQPTVAPTFGPVALTQEGLTPVLLQAGDLPDGWTGGKLYDESPVDYEGPKPRVVLNQGLLEPGAKFASGNVVLWVFATKEDAQRAYKQRTDLYQRTAVKSAEFRQPPIGDHALLIPGQNEMFVLNQLVAIRCNAVIEMLYGTNKAIEQTTNYATRLDQRIQPTACP